MAERLTTGFTKSIKFISTDWFREPVPVAVGTSTHQFQFSTSVVHPLRIWVVPYPYITFPIAGVAGLNAVSAGSREMLTDPTFAPGVVCGYFTQTNILVNNGQFIHSYMHHCACYIFTHAYITSFCIFAVPYFRQNFQTVDDLWEQLREQLSVLMRQISFCVFHCLYDVLTLICLSLCSDPGQSNTFNLAYSPHCAVAA